MVLSFYVDDVSGEEVRTLIDEFEGNADVVLGDEVRVTGKPVLNRNVIENVTAGLTPMTLLSFGLGLVFLTLAFWSARVSVVLVAGVAASAALMVTGAMYAFGIPWNPLTVTMSSMALGIGIDYGIHVYERYEEEVLKGENSRDAVVTSLERLARPVLGSSVTTMAGFCVLVFSRFPVLSNFGKTVVARLVPTTVETRSNGSEGVVSDGDLVPPESLI
jgi:predicted RND superfamily exporter protein